MCIRLILSMRRTMFSLHGQVDVRHLRGYTHFGFVDPQLHDFFAWICREHVISSCQVNIFTSYDRYNQHSTKEIKMVSNGIEPVKGSYCNIFGLSSPMRILLGFLKETIRWHSFWLHQFRWKWPKCRHRHTFRQKKFLKSCFLCLFVCRLKQDEHCYMNVALQSNGCTST